MVEHVTHEGDDIVEFTIGGTVTADDYEQVIVPALDAAAKSGTGELRILFTLEGDDLPGFTAGAMLDDAKLGIHHWRDFHRMTVITDSSVVHKLAPIVSALVPGQVKAFDLAHRSDAYDWVKG